MTASVEICSVCAWRGPCQKKFSLSGKNVHCPDFVKDLSLTVEETKEKQEEERKKL